MVMTKAEMKKVIKRLKPPSQIVMKYKKDTRYSYPAVERKVLKVGENGESFQVHRRFFFVAYGEWITIHQLEHLEMTG